MSIQSHESSGPSRRLVSTAAIAALAALAIWNPLGKDGRAANAQSAPMPAPFSAALETSGGNKVFLPFAVMPDLGQTGTPVPVTPTPSATPTVEPSPTPTSPSQQVTMVGSTILEDRQWVDPQNIVSSPDGLVEVGEIGGSGNTTSRWGKYDTQEAIISPSNPANNDAACYIAQRDKARELKEFVRVVTGSWPLDCGEVSVAPNGNIIVLMNVNAGDLPVTSHAISDSGAPRDYDPYFGGGANKGFSPYITVFDKNFKPVFESYVLPDNDGTYIWGTQLISIPGSNDSAYVFTVKFNGPDSKGTQKLQRINYITGESTYIDLSGLPNLSTFKVLANGNIFAVGSVSSDEKDMLKTVGPQSVSWGCEGKQDCGHVYYAEINPDGTLIRTGLLPANKGVLHIPLLTIGNDGSPTIITGYADESLPGSASNEGLVLPSAYFVADENLRGITLDQGTVLPSAYFVNLMQEDGSFLQVPLKFGFAEEQILETAPLYDGRIIISTNQNPIGPTGIWREKFYILDPKKPGSLEQVYYELPYGNGHGAHQGFINGTLNGGFVVGGMTFNPEYPQANNAGKVSVGFTAAYGLPSE